MVEYLIRRIPSVALVIAATSVIAFALPRLAPGDPAVAAAGSDARPETVEQIRAEMGLDNPLWVQYWDWIGGLLRGDAGLSFVTQRPVTALIGDRLASTLELAVLAGVLMVVLGVALGVLTATVRSGPIRVALDAVNSVLLAAPPFLTGLLLILLFGITLPLLPVSGEVSVLDNGWQGIQYLIMPAVGLALPQAAAISRLLATSMRTTQQEEFVDLARAKGVAPARITRRHVLRNSLGSALVMIGLRMGELLAGAIVIEAIFGRHGLGSLAVSSVQTRDYLVIQTLILGAVLVAVVMQLLTEVGVAALDPRVRLEASS